MLGPGTDFLVEDCEIERYGNNFIVQGFGGVYENVRVRRCVLSDPFRTDSGNTNMYIENVRGILLEENVITNLIANDAAGNLLSHNVYIQETCAANTATVRGNIVYNGRTNLTVRCGGLVANNLVIRGGQGICIGFIGAASVPAVVRGNVITESRNHWNGQELGFGIVFDDAVGVDCGHNLIFHPTDGGYHLAVAINPGDGQIDFHDNVIYDWARSTGDAVGVFVNATAPGPFTIRNNTVQQPIRGLIFVHHQGSPPSISYQVNRVFSADPAPFFDGSFLTLAQWQSTREPTAIGAQSNFPDPARSPGTYNASRAGTATTEGFILAARGLSRATWRPIYTAPVANNYFREGFGVTLP
jgi:hypothetical protein